MKTRSIFLLLAAAWIGLSPAPATATGPFIEIPASELEDRIRGGLIGQIFGNLNGLPHEMAYIDNPGKVESYLPALPEGARTDDDTDIEWVYLAEIQKTRQLFTPPKRIGDLWRAYMNDGIWCANLYARNLLDLGIDPPLTGRIAINPWSVFNISGQFVSEAWGLVAPAMPQAAARLGTHYTHYAVDGEPIQATQLWSSMIATAFVQTDLIKIVEAGRAAIDKKSALGPIITDVMQWWRDNPSDWRATRLKIKQKYTHQSGDDEGDRNGYELNTASVIGSLLYGGGDLKETLRLAFNFGWDADCNAAITGAIIGVMKGAKWIAAQGWVVKDVYKNTVRGDMPKDETITRYGDRLWEVARMVIEKNGGQRVMRDGQTVYRIKAQRPAPVELLPKPLDRMKELRRALLPAIAKDLDGDALAKSRGAYLALALGEADRLAKSKPAVWQAALSELRQRPAMLTQIFVAPVPMATPIQTAAAAHGLKKPEKPASK